jgi:hypothetical protein
MLKHSAIFTAGLYHTLPLSERVDLSNFSPERPRLFDWTPHFDKKSVSSAKAPIYKTASGWYDDFGSFPISHPFGPHSAARCAAPFYVKRLRKYRKSQKLRIFLKRYLSTNVS